MADDDPSDIPKKPSREMLEELHKQAQLMQFMPPDIKPEEQELYSRLPKSKYDLLSGNYELAPPRKRTRKEIRALINEHSEVRRKEDLERWIQEELTWPFWKRFLFHGVLDGRTFVGFLIGIVVMLLAFG